MKKAFFCLALFTTVAAQQFAWAAPEVVKTSSSRFWGKITAVDPAGKTLTVFNRNRKETAKFAWTPSTTFTNDKNSMQPQELAVGQFLRVDYEGTGDHRIASIVAVRPPPFKKKPMQ